MGMQVIQPTLFDYGDLDPDIRIAVQQRTGEIKSLMKRAAQDIIDIGEKLTEVKERLGHGRFGAWLRAEFEWSADTALRFVQVSTAFRQIPQIAVFDPSALYALAAPSTPQPARLEAIARAQAGESITYTTARDIIANHAARDKAVKSELAKLDPNERYIVGQRVDLVTSTAQEIHQAVERYKAEEVIGPERAQAEAEYAEAKRVNEFLHRITAVRQWMDALAAEEPITAYGHPGPSLADAMFEWSEAIRAAASRVAVRYMDDSVQPRIRRIK